MTDTGSHADEGVGAAWTRIETSLSRILPASLRQLAGPAEAKAIDAAQAALAVVLPRDFRASLGIHNGTVQDRGRLSPVPLEILYDTDEIVEATLRWRDNYDPDPVWHDPRVWAHVVDTRNLFLNGPVRPIVGSAGAVLVGDMNGDVLWYLDFDPAPGGTPGQVVRADIECSTWDVLAPSWAQLLARYAEDLELFAAAPGSSTLEIDPDCGPACEWGSTPVGASSTRPAWLWEVPALDPHSG